MQAGARSPGGVIRDGRRAVLRPGGCRDGQRAVKAARGADGTVVRVTAGGQGLEPGEVLISAGRAAIKLSPDGRVAVAGSLTVNGIQVAPRGTEG